MKEPDRDQSKVENLLAIQDGNHELRNLYQNVFPTTWLARTDALVQARATLFDFGDIELKKIVKESYKTTPRYVIKVYRVQRKTVPIFGRQHEIWLSYFFVRSLVPKLVNSIKNFRTHFLS
jgi:hypothetical protein